MNAFELAQKFWSDVPQEKVLALAAAGVTLGTLVEWVSNNYRVECDGDWQCAECDAYLWGKETHEPECRIAKFLEIMEVPE